MLDRFPTEILLDILDSPRPTNGYERREDLYNLCLVSRKLRLVLQPVLWKEVRVSKWEHVATVVANRSEEALCGATWRLVVDMPKNNVGSLLPSLLRALPDLHGFQVRQARNFTLTDGLLRLLHGLNSLDTLVLVSAAVQSFIIDPLPLASLTSLAIHLSHIPHSFAEALLTSTILPSLKALSISPFLDPVRRSRPYLPTLPQTLLEQLDVLQLPNDHTAPSTHCASTVPILFTLRPQSVQPQFLLQQANLRHIAFHHPLGSGSAQLVDVWDAVAVKHVFEESKFVASSSSQVETIWLRSALNDGSTFASYLDRVRSQLEEACTVAGVEIHWLEGEDDNANGRGVSDGFWRYVKQLKAQREEQ